MLIAMVVAAATTGYLATLVTAPRNRAQRTLATISAYGYDAAPVHVDEEQEEDVPERSLIEQVGAVVLSRLRRDRLEKVRKDLVAAGMYDMTAERWLGLCALCLFAVPIVMIWLVISTKASPAIAMLELGFGAYAGWAFPQTTLTRRARQRLEAIDRGMPELVDLLVVAVESGQSFGAAMRSAGARVHGPVRDELGLVLQEMSLGISMTDAFKHFVERVDVPSTRSFARTLLQGERLGVSVGAMLRSLSEELRKQRKAHAEEQAQKTPVKILFPLIFFIFPSLFIVLLTPAAIQIAGGLG